MSLGPRRATLPLHNDLYCHPSQDPLDESNPRRFTAHDRRALHGQDPILHRVCDPNRRLVQCVSATLIGAGPRVDPIVTFIYRLEDPTAGRRERRGAGCAPSRVRRRPSPERGSRQTPRALSVASPTQLTSSARGPDPAQTTRILPACPSP